jgi:hypothetical protein
MGSILVPIDFTEQSSDAARYAADMAAAIGANIQLIHVQRVPEVTSAGPLPADVLEEIRNSCLSSLETLANELTQRTGGKVYVATYSETGNFETIVKAFCQWKKPLFIVTGPLPIPPTYRLSFPVLVVPPNTVFHPIHSIVIACDHEDLSTGIPIPIQFFQQIRDLFGVRFDLIHVSIKEDNDEKKAIAAFTQWKHKLTGGFPEIHFTHAASVEEGISHYLHSHHADWLMVFPKKTGLFRFHKNLSTGIILHCPLPTMSMTG